MICCVDSPLAEFSVIETISWLGSSILELVVDLLRDLMKIWNSSPEMSEFGGRMNSLLIILVWWSR